MRMLWIILKRGNTLDKRAWEKSRALFICDLMGRRDWMYIHIQLSEQELKTMLDGDYISTRVGDLQVDLSMEDDEEEGE